MKFRPCIDIHNGKVKQIVGSTLSDANNSAKENFVSERSAADFASMFRRDGLMGGHVILLNSASSPFYEETKEQALQALEAFPGGMMAGGGITPENADLFLDAGASHVIVTSYVFFNGEISYVNLGKLETEVGKERLVLDLSCRKKGEDYYIMTDRWQKFTRTPLSPALLARLSGHCDEFLVHAIDSEGKGEGIDWGLVRILRQAGTIPITYAGGISSFEDLEELRKCGHDRIDATIGSALSIYGGSMDYRKVLATCK